MNESQPKSNRRRYTESERREIIADYETSGLSQARIASKHGLSSNTLHNWLRAKRKTQANKKRSPKLLPVNLTSGKSNDSIFSSDPAFEIMLRSNRQLRIPSGFDPGEVRLLLRILEETC